MVRRPASLTIKPMLEVTGLYAGYDSMEVLHGVDLAIDEGQIVALLGSNGAGKSTLNNTLSGIIQPRLGSIRFGGRDIVGTSPEHIVAGGLVQVPEGRRIFPNMSVLENLEMGGYRRGRKRRARNLARVTEVFPRLAERFSQLAGTLSGGEQQMLAIGRGMMSEPRLLILDEPSLGLSPLLVEEMFTLIGQLNEQGLSILLVEQNVFQSLAIADRAYVLENGSVTLQGASADLLDNAQLRKSYLGM
jgi:branched-chain amino acid transport system ATP-binding protein